ncbi:Protein phosphatase 4 core regulatory subunit R2 [Raphanus sativus]|nr:Protein phosphatase 4 core regulatory subunit R2 [Raphanus sativus]
MPEEEVKCTLEAVASTGKFWQDWEKLKGMLSWWLKKVLSEYPEAKMTDERQKEALGETYSVLVTRLDEALLSFDEGPPFTLQRLCELPHRAYWFICLQHILLAARSIYPKLSKLALALEKTLLVTSMLSISTDPQLQTTEDTNAAATEDTNTPKPCFAQTNPTRPTATHVFLRFNASPGGHRMSNPGRFLFGAYHWATM